MAIYNFKDNRLNKIDLTTFNNEGILERNHLQNAIKNQIGVISPDCLVISEEFSEWSESLRRIDLLAIDKQANLIVIELKRTESGDQMELQAIRYAAMVSTLTFSQAIQIYKKYLLSIFSDLDPERSLLDFLNWEEPHEDEFASDVKIVLVSSNFSKEVTSSVIWLNERNLDIRCVRLIPYRFDNQILIDVQQIIPLPETESFQVKIKQKSEEIREARNSEKDYSKYLFEGQTYNKRKLVNAVIHSWINKNNPSNFDELLRAFPQETRIAGGLFVPFDVAIEIRDRSGQPRHFLNDNDLIKLPDSSCYAISNQWGSGNIGPFITKSRNNGLAIFEC
ncbi:MAG: hypothetical protein KA218_01425 [Arenimonas sp.]|nr:hypothetical protein [Arenimonas sp.]